MTNPAYASIEELKDVRPPVDLPPNYFVILFIAGIILLILLALAGRWLLEYFKKQKNAPRLPPKSAWQIAEEELAALEKENLPARGEIKEYFIRLSGIVRHYLERRFSMSAPEMTTDEFLEYMKTTNVLTEMQKQFLREFLMASDMVKFARYGSTQEEMSSAFALAKRLVEETIPAGDSS